MLVTATVTSFSCLLLQLVFRIPLTKLVMLGIGRLVVAQPVVEEPNAHTYMHEMHLYNQR